MKYSVFGIHSELYNSQRNTLIIEGLGSTKCTIATLYRFTSPQWQRGCAQTFGRHSDNLEMATKENEHHRSEMVAMQKLSETQLSREVIRREKLEHQLQIIESSKAEIEQERDQLRAEADTLRGKPRKGAKGSVEPQAAADEPGDEDRSAARDRTDGPVMEPLAPFRHSSQNILRLY